MVVKSFVSMCHSDSDLIGDFKKAFKMFSKIIKTKSIKIIPVGLYFISFAAVITHCSKLVCLLVSVHPSLIFVNQPEAIFLVMCDPSMNEL